MDSHNPKSEPQAKDTSNFDSLTTAEELQLTLERWVGRWEGRMLTHETLGAYCRMECVLAWEREELCAHENAQLIDVLN